MGKRVSQHKNRTGLIAALDLGTTKASCFIARMVTEGEPKVIGVGHRVSKGVKCGAIIDMGDVEDTIRATVEAAEQMAGENIREVIVNLSGGQPKSRLIAYEVSVGGHEIGDADMRRVLDPASLYKELPPEHELVHAIPVGYSVDGNRGVRDPNGLFGQRLGVNMHMVSAPVGSTRNLEISISRCHLGIQSKVISPYASALACLSDDEKQLGVTYMDIGGGTTSIAVFFDNELVHTDSIPLGGMHVTNDIARGLSTPVNHAERIKTMFGSAIPSSSDDQEIIVALLGLIFSYLPTPWLTKRSMKETKSWKEVWDLLYTHYEVKPNQITFIRYNDMKCESDERPWDFYCRMVYHVFLSLIYRTISFSVSPTISKSVEPAAVAILEENVIGILCSFANFKSKQLISHLRLM